MTSWAIVHRILQARILQWVAFPSSGDLSNSGIEPRFSALQVDSLPAEPQRKPKNTGVGSLSLLQWIFTTQKLNQGLLHCRQIFYQLRYEGSPKRVAKEHSNYCTIALISHTSKVILKILQARFQQYVNLELPDV